MTIVILTAVPPGLRGHLTRWLLELSPGVFVGHISPRVRELMWDRIVEFVADGRALMVHTARNEQRLVFTVHGHDWTPVDFDGLTLLRRQTVPDYIPVYQHTPAQQATRSAEHQSETVWRRRTARRKFKPKPPKDTGSG
ncbi:type I-E CRISPR-associated endoribonuclease Cas2e [Nocardia cyriacigeorgica]|uniref:type I-E CRISPR-associated endoribonuclease Cas2e n=1 Tax=Nocardia cyriacigeorgica TaxID=135487 RepID=UPI0018932F2F|nr:type I-E CRISPR-associated endoribonuclease Cas2e [Nocardia cyriacigeorgica]MBF6416874.1 type I-E CRISPR-associated endoribonuclease Cas2 [Nocardia cyriacigeorgica]